MAKQKALVANVVASHPQRHRDAVRQATQNAQARQDALTAHRRGQGRS